METNGISLNQEGTRNSRRPQSFALAAFAGVAIAGAALGFACGANRGAGDDGAAGAATFSHDTADSSTQAATGAQGSPNVGQSAGEPVAPDEGAQVGDDGPTETPADEPSPTPTATPQPGDPCPLCPDGVDDLVAPEPEGDPCPLCPDDIVIPAVTPVNPCPLCDDPMIAADPVALAFEHSDAEHCDGQTVLSAVLNRPAFIWAEYTEADGSDEHQTPKFYNDSLYFEIDGSWVWFGGWGWIYAYNITFHAMDEDGEQISEWANPQYC